MGESQSNRFIERTVGLVAGQARTMKAAQVPLDVRILFWLVEFAAYLMKQIGERRKSIGTTQTAWTKGQHTDPGIWREDPVHAWGIIRGTAIPSRSVCWLAEVFVRGSSCHEEELAMKAPAANIRRLHESERWDADRILGIPAVLRSPDRSDGAFDIQVGMERPAEMVARRLEKC